MGDPASGLLRDENRRLARQEFAERAAVVASRPRALFLELTRHCNLACPMCRYPGEVPSTQRMSGELFDRVEAELFPTADLIDLRGWGESLILPEFPNRARRAAHYGAALRVVTNLSFRRDTVLNVLAEYGFHVGVSIDSANPDVLSFLRRGARLELIEANLHRLGALYAARGFSDRLNLYVTCQLPALDSLQDLVDLASRHGVTDLRLAPVGTTLPFLTLKESAVQLDEALQRVRERGVAAGVRVSFTASLLDGMYPHLDDGACLHPWAWCYVAYDGRVGFCDHLIAADHYTLGSLAEKSFEEIWNGPAWVELRREHSAERRASAPYFHECAWCYKNRHVDCEDLVEPKYAERRLMLTQSLTSAASRLQGC